MQPDTKERLLRSGATLFADRGFDGVSVREICRHADTSRNMIHHYFGSKDGLLQAILEQFGNDSLTLPIRVVQKPPQSKEDFISRMSLLFETTLEAYIERRAYLMVVLREQADLNALENYYHHLVAFVEAGQEAGYVNPRLDLEMITGAMLDRILSQVQFSPWLKRSFGIDIENDAEYRRRWCDANVELFLNGLLL